MRRRGEMSEASVAAWFMLLGSTVVIAILIVSESPEYQHAISGWLNHSGGWWLILSAFPIGALCVIICEAVRKHKNQSPPPR